MMVLTAKVDLKKTLTIIGIIAAVLIAGIWVFGGDDTATATAVPPVSTNDGRVSFLTSFGWNVTPSPTESSQIRIPEENSEVFERYNTLQKSQGLFIV